ncbi:MAG: folate family ECF transporter S component [Oscillospiraceae bacterium]|nr:folate family ECF transporter S component [Oscillospiraceae bacterium]
MAFFGIFKRSAAELKDIRCLVVTAMLIGLELALKGLTIEVMDNLKVSVAFITKASVGMLYGPTVAFFGGLVSDIIGFIIKPTGAFSPLFTLQEGFAAMLYGLFLYNLKLSRKELHDKTLQKQSTIQIIRIVLAKLSVVVFINLLYTPFALIVTNSMAAGELVYGSVLTGYPVRLMKNAIQFPADCILLIAFLPIVSTAYNLVFKRNIKVNKEPVGKEPL